jgi:hypothetical protein
MRSPILRRMAGAFGSEVVFDMAGEPGMLRRAATEEGVPTLVFEAGEPLKFQKKLIRRGVEGIKNVLADLKMAAFERRSPLFQIVVTDHRWIRAQKGGILNVNVKPGDIIEKGDTIAVNTKPFGTEVSRLRAPHSGLVVGCTTVPMVLPGQPSATWFPWGRAPGSSRRCSRGRNSLRIGIAWMPPTSRWPGDYVSPVCWAASWVSNARSTASPRGLRTHMIVSLGACLIMLVSMHMADLSPAKSDPARIAAQVVAGVGFLGAGAIMRSGLSVRGLTTAACLWTVAAIAWRWGAATGAPGS